MDVLEAKHANNMSSLRTPSHSKLCCITTTEFTFSNAFNVTSNYEHPFALSPSFGPKTVNSSYNYSSPPTTAAQNKIIEMMNNLPESCHELSLDDIVVDGHENVRFMVEQKSDLKRSFKGKKTVRRKQPISRSVSLDTGVFMLKMFLPISLGSKKFHSSSNKSSFNKNSHIGSSDKSNGNCMFANTKSRSELAPGCWFINKTWKPKRQRGCIY